MKEREIQDHQRPELRRSPEEKRLGTRKGDRISWETFTGELSEMILSIIFFIFIFSHSLIVVEIFTKDKAGFSARIVGFDLRPATFILNSSAPLLYCDQRFAEP